jgi:N-acetylneuraminic acid mutarotase
VFVTSVVGSDETSSRMTSEIYDPATHQWSAAAPLDGPYLDELLPLTDGRVLGIGSGFEISLLLEVYDPADNTWTPIQTPPVAHARPHFVALPRGRILAAGGFTETDTGGGPTDKAETYDPGTNRWTAAGSLKTARAEAATATLPDGRVIFAGGQAGDDFNGQALAAVEAFHLDTGAWTPMADLLQPRYGAEALVLADGSVLLLGGYADFNVNGDTPWCPTPITSVERLSPAP